MDTYMLANIIYSAIKEYECLSPCAEWTTFGPIAEEVEKIIADPNYIPKLFPPADTRTEIMTMLGTLCMRINPPPEAWVKQRKELILIFSPGDIKRGIKQ